MKLFNFQITKTLILGTFLWGLLFSITTVQAATVTGDTCESIKSDELKFQVNVSGGSFSLDEMTISWDGSSPSSLSDVEVDVGNNCNKATASSYDSGDALTFSSCTLSPSNNPSDIIIKYTQNGGSFSRDQDISVSFVSGTDIYTVRIARQNNGNENCSVTGNESGSSGGGSCETFRDEFSTESYNRQDGTVDWATNWDEVGDNNAVSNGDIEISSGRLQLEGDGSASNSLGGPYIQREVDLSSYSSATLTFDYRETGDWEGSDYIDIYVSANGGGNWTRLRRFSNDQGSSWGQFSEDITAYISSNTRIAFVERANSENEIFYFDNVQIEACGGDASTIESVEYHFDESVWSGASGEVIDSSGNDFHATAENGVVTEAVSPAIPGSPGTCNYGVFDGVDDYVAVPNKYPNISSDFTITAWIRTHDNSRSGQRILIDDPNNTQGFGFSLGDGGTGQVRFFSRSTSPIYLDTPRVVENDRWYFVAAVADISNNTKKIYVYDQAGNQLTATSGTYTGPWGYDVGDVSMGGENDASGESGTDFHFEGNIDEVQVHSGALTASEIEAIQLDVHDCVYPLAEYRFEGCDWTTGVTVIDEMGNYPGVVVQGAHTALGSDYGGGLCNVANLENDGTDYNRYISLAGNPISLSGDWTLMMWINFPPVFTNHYQAEGYRYSVISGGTNDLAWIRQQDSDGYREWGTSSNTSAHRAAFPSSLTGWHHLTFVAQGSQTDLYVDGAYSNTVNYKQTGTYTRIGTSADDGYISNTQRQNLDTQLDELKFYNGALSATEISSIYSLENSGFRWDGSSLNCQLCSTVDHIRIEHTGAGLTCQRSDIVLRACADSTCSSEATDAVSVTMTPTTDNPPTWIGGDSYTFTGNQTIQLRQTEAVTVTLGLSNPSPEPTNGYVCYDSGTSGDCGIVFYESGFLFDVPDLSSCQPSSDVSIQAVRMDATTQTCIADSGFAGANKTVNFWSSYVNPGSGSEQISLSGTGIATSGSGTDISLSFDDTASSSFTVTYPDAGQMQLNARYDGVGTEEAGLVMVGNDDFVARPVGLCVYSDDANADCVTGNGGCSVFKKVDETFNLKVKGVCWEGSADADFCVGNATTQNFQLNTIPITHSLIAPSSSGSSAGSIGVSSIDILAADSGEHVIADQTVSEVGVFTFTATPPNYFGSALPVATSTNIGRFTPDHFITSIADHGALQDGCSGFTYSGQPFGYQDGRRPQMSITAVRGAGGTTVNYRDDFVKLTDPATQIDMPAVTSDASNLGADGLTLLDFTWAPAVSSLVANDNGTLDFSLGADQFSYTRNVNALVAPFNSDIQLSVTGLSDSDSIVATDMPRSFSPAATEIRYGKMQLQNAYGSETLPLTIPVLTEYFNGSTFTLNSLDHCTSYDSIHLVLNNYQNNLSAGDTIASGSGSLLSGLGQGLVLSAPGVGHDGNVDLVYDLDAAGLQWLKPGGVNPTGKATFGIFKGNDRLIYMRESIW